MWKTVFPKSKDFCKIIFRCNCSAGTVTRLLFTAFGKQGGAVLFAASKSCRFSHHPLRVPKAWHRDFAACGQRSELLALNLANIFEKLLDQKTFSCLRQYSWKTNCIQFGKAGAHPQLALGIAIAPETLFSHCNLLILMAIAILCDSLLDFCLRFSIRFYLLRKCGLLAHTSPTFLKNCWIKKLLVACGSYLTANSFLQIPC